MNSAESNYRFGLWSIFRRQSPLREAVKLNAMTYLNCSFILHWISFWTLLNCRYRLFAEDKIKLRKERERRSVARQRQPQQQQRQQRQRQLW